MIPSKQEKKAYVINTESNKSYDNPKINKKNT